MPIAALGNLLAGVEAIDVNLDQMKPNSKFLAALQQSEDPRVPYTIVAGNTSIIKPVNNESSGKFLRLFEKLEKLRKSAVEFPFLGEPNDIACLVSSIKDLPPDRTPAPQIKEAACNHLDYFKDTDGLRVLAEAVLATSIDGGPEPAPTLPPVPVPVPVLVHEQAMSVSELQTEQPLVQSAFASLPITAPAQMPSPVAKVQQPAFRIISAILIALGLTGGLAFMQHKLQTQPKTNGATTQLVPPMDRNLGSKSTAIEEMMNHG
jgi:hypothetical protein